MRVLGCLLCLFAGMVAGNGGRSIGARAGETATDAPDVQAETSGADEAGAARAYSATAAGVGLWPEDFAGKPRPQNGAIGEIVYLRGDVGAQALPPESNVSFAARPPAAGQAGASPIRVLRAHDRARAGESVTTGPGAYFEVLFGANVRVLLAPDSALAIERVDDLPDGGRRWGLRLARGTLRLRVARNLRRPERAVVSTANLSALLDGGDIVLTAGSEAKASADSPPSSVGGVKNVNEKAAIVADMALALSGGVWVKPAERKGKPSRPARLEADAGEALRVPAGDGLPVRVRTDEKSREAWRAGLAFLPERQRSALPPAPPEGYGSGGL